MNPFEPGLYLDNNGAPFKVWAGGGVAWYGDEVTTGDPLPSNPLRVLALTPEDWMLVRQALEDVYWDHRASISPDAHERLTADVRERLHAIAGSMYPGRQS